MSVFDVTTEEIYNIALDTYGADAQTLMVFEEMSELQKELCKWARGADNREAIAEEIADVQIMLEQMIMLHDIKREVTIYKHDKVVRLGRRLNYFEPEVGDDGCRIE